MVLSFIDTQNGITFNGSRPFVFWFEDGQSVNMIYTKRIAFLSDQQTETVSTESGSPFFLIDRRVLETIQPTELSNESYFDLSSVKSSNIYSDGFQYNGMWVHMVYLGASSDTAGQFTGSMFIGNEEYSIGADFYNADETLTGNLENLGIEIPGTVQKAIYESNVHEEASDNILMNRKWKELLLEYWGIAARKGSYKSLVNSLKWFEYGDLVKILEYWKRNDTDRTKYLSNDIEQILSDLFRDQLSVLTKTTYIGLYLALEKPSSTEFEDSEMPFFNSSITWSGSADPNILQGVYQGTAGWDNMMLNENNPVLYRIASLWGASDLSLKMTLVGNFFSTYFMPVHLDLIHSTIENIIFTNNVKVFSAGEQQRDDFLHLPGTFRCSTVDNDSIWHMQPVDCWVGPMTILGLKSDAAPANCPTVLGFDHVREESEEDPVQMDIRDILFSAVNRYSAYGAPVKFSVRIDDRVTQNDFLKGAQIHWTRNGSEVFDYNDRGIYIAPKLEDDSYIYEFSFDILFEKYGGYEIGITFESSRGIWYSKKFKISVSESTDNRISMYKIRRGDLKTWENAKLAVQQDGDRGSLLITNPDSDIESNVNEFMFSSTEDFTEMYCAQFISASGLNFSKAVGLNHVIMFIDGESRIKSLSMDPPASATKEVSLTPQALPIVMSDSHWHFNIADLISTFPHYWWEKHTVFTEMKDVNKMNPRTDEEAEYRGYLKNHTEKTVIIGMRKYFSTTNTNERVLFEKSYKYWSGNTFQTYNVKILQVGNRIWVNTWKGSNGPVTSKSIPMTDHVTVDFGVHKIDVKIRPDCATEPSNLRYDRGQERYRVKINYQNGAEPYRVVDEDRFVPLFHILEPITSSNYELGEGEVAIAVPHFRRTKTDDNNSVIMSFRHCGTSEWTEYKNGITGNDNLADSNGQPMVGITVRAPLTSADTIIANFDKHPLKSGFYDVAVRYKYGSEWKTEITEGAFKIL